MSAPAALPEDLATLRRKLADAEALLDAIRQGQVDALVVGDPEEEQVFTLESADLPYRQFLEQMGEGAVSLDAEGRILFCNRFFASLVGKPREDVLSMPFESFLVPFAREEYRRAVADGRLTHLGLGLQGPQGQKIPVQVAITSAGHEDQRRFTLVVTDLSERERLRELNVLREASEAANLAKDQFLASVGHDLRTPLQVVKGWAQFLLKRSAGFDAPTRKALAAIDRNADLQRKLIDDLLDVSRIVSGKLRLERGVLELSGLAQGCVSAMALNAEALGIKLTCESSLPVFVDGDPERLAQVLNNLIGNAIKFTSRGGHVDVLVAQVSDVARIEVRDDGQGIDPVTLPHVFDRFKQGGPSARPRESGLGLGLAITKHIVELHGGGVHASSAGRGRGATFTVELPALSMEAGVPSALDPPPPVEVTFEGRRVLVVDDREESRDLLTRLLGERRAEVVAVADGSAALAWLEQETFDLVVSDLLMPGLDGWELATELRKRHGAERPVLAVSSQPADEAVTRAKAAGFSAYLAKPLDEPELLRTVARLLQAS